MSTLPRFMVLTSRLVPKRFLSYTEGTYKDDTLEKSLPGLLQFHEENIFSPKVKLAVEPSATGNGRLVHIRSCYNNKYLVSHTFNCLPAGTYVAALSDKPEEDQSKDTCTLFECVFTGDNLIRLRHAQDKTFAIYGNQFTYSTIFHDIIIPAGIVQDFKGGYQEFSFIDWEKLVILPSRVSFRSEDLDRRYLCSNEQDGLNYQMFKYADVGNHLVAKELFPTNDGKYRIKDGYFGRFWRLSPNWIWADAEDSNTSDDTLFTIVKLADNVVALRNVRNNNFVGPLTCDFKTNCLNANYPRLSKEVRLIVEELVVSRKIYNITYRLSDARVYEEQIIEFDSDTSTNNSPDKDTVSTLTFSVTDTVVRNWNSSVSLELGVRTEFEVSAIPFIIEAKVDVSTTFNTSYEWGGSKSVDTTRSVSYQVNVPPMSTVKVSVMAKRAKCDIPFSYTQRDLLHDNRTVTTVMDDGIYTGINSYDLYCDSSPVK